MKVRTRLFLVFLVLVGLGFYQLVDWILADLRPRYLATMEESMVETATLLSSLVATQVKGGALDAEDLQAALDLAESRSLKAQIYELQKAKLAMRVYVTNSKGIVVFDSDDGRDEGNERSRRRRRR